MRRYSVAVGISFHSGRVLLGRRIRSESQYAGYWEFPGGKIELGESSVDALKREFREELGTEVLRHQDFVQMDWVYPDRIVDLHFFLVKLSEVKTELLERNAHSEIRWVPLDEALLLNLLPANIEIVQRLQAQSNEVLAFFDFD
jgi:8-oxo-dGTP diphosphatase